MEESSYSARIRVRRHPERGHYEPDLIAAILDEALWCHVAFVRNGQPMVLPTTHVRIENRLYVHGAPASGMLTALSQEAPIAVTATLLDGLVLARSAFHHSMNYRSVVILGTAQPVDDLEEKKKVLEALVNHVVPERASDVRPPTTSELRATKVLSLALDEASAKIRTGPPVDDPADEKYPVWAGVIPTEITLGTPVPDGLLSASFPLPTYLASISTLGRGAR